MNRPNLLAPKWTLNRQWSLIAPSACALTVIWLAACGGGSAAGPPPPPVASPNPQPYLPLAVGDTWTYACYLGTPAPGASSFPKTNQVIGTTTVSGVLTYEYAEQIPSSPTMSTTQIQLLANDAAANTILYGYMANPAAAPMPVTPTVIVAASPGAEGAFFDYPSEGGGTVSQVFCCIGSTNGTAFGTFTVAEYFDGSHSVKTATDGYGYAVGKGVMEEDHNFNSPNGIDCVVTQTPPP